jgi:hypothetical protein
MNSLFSMKSRLTIALSLLALTGAFDRLWGQSTAFTYQGRLLDRGHAANGLYDLQFTLADSPTNGNQVGPLLTAKPLSVTNGLFLVTLDFGGSAFNGSERWLDLGVRSNGDVGPYTGLMPRQPIGSIPYATFASAAATANTAGGLADGGASLTSIPVASLVGTVAVDQLPANLAAWATISPDAFPQATNTFAGITNALGYLPATNGLFAGDGTGLIISGSNIVDSISTRLLSGRLFPGLLPYQLPNWAGIAPESKQDALGYVPATNSFSGIVSALGYVPNSGGVTNIPGNAATADYANYTGTASNAPGSQYALVVKGSQTNEGGIYINNANGLSFGILLGTDGGIATGGYLTVANNTRIFDIPATSQSMVQLGCDVPNGLVTYWGHPFLLHFDQVEGGYATSDNFPFGCNTFTIGAYGQVVLNNPLSQSWDQYEPEFESPQLVFQSEILTGPGQWGVTNYWGFSQLSNVFTIGPMVGISNVINGPEAGFTRSHVLGSVLPAIVITTNGNVGIGTSSPATQLEVAGTVSATGFLRLSDRNAKAGLRDVNVQEVLEAVTDLPVQRWHFIGDAQTDHIGPMAQDFSAAFKLGSDDKHIDTVDAEGVAFAAIQGLNQKLVQAVKQQQNEIAELRQRLEKLEQFLNTRGAAQR